MNRLVAVLLLASLAGCGEAEAAQRARLIDSAGKVLVTLRLAIADTEYERQEGLRLHGPLAHDEALLMIFPAETHVCITNAGVPFPIDVLYLSADRQVTAIERNIPADTPGPYCERAQQILELQGNTLPPLNQAKLELF